MGRPKGRGTNQCKICNGKFRQFVDDLYYNFNKDPDNVKKEHPTYIEMRQACKEKGFEVGTATLNRHFVNCKAIETKVMQKAKKMKDEYDAKVNKKLTQKAEEMMKFMPEALDTQGRMRTVELTEEQFDRYTEALKFLDHQAKGLSKQAEADVLLFQAKSILNEIMRDKTYNLKDVTPTLRAVREIIETCAKLTGELSDPMQNPQVQQFVQVFINQASQCPKCQPVIEAELQALTK